ncbi:biotin--[acetyl-CoA-carboxylase] ligase [Fodinicola acaciae]|uniref:biotin--[acetyl-CoA-carboxylase] ligase n=1 Tax=Fodinicola acaciae TaxID=2681555 RepID=UPI0013D23DF5|nr:biotin--[acetyl-CoA-carboxylase] ligase [Fodinicola acaciae]
MSKYADLDRPPLSETNLRRALQRDFWTDVRVVAETGSTNADVAALADTGAPEGLVVLAEYQGAGRGRRDRTWVSPPRAGISVSMLLRPAAPAPRWGWLSLLAGVAAARSVREVAGLEVSLKWPNDLLAGAGKVAGILAEAHGAAVVLGIGLNVTNTAAELPERAGAPASSLRLAGATCTDRDTIVRALLRAVAEDYRDWSDAHGDPDASGLRVAYRTMCRTVGQRVSVELPTGRTLDGEATDIDADGRLVVRTADGTLTPVAAGDVTHVNPARG